MQCIEPKYYSLKYFNLYLLIKISCSEFTDKILEVDKADLLDLKKYIKRENFILLPIIKY